MLSFLFWNLFKKPLRKRVACVAVGHQIDVLILAECAFEPTDLLVELNRSGGPTYRFPANPERKIRIFARLPLAAFTNEFDDPAKGVSVRQLRVGEPPGILLAAVHLPSRVNWDREDMTLHMTALADDLIRLESAFGHERTIVVGDMNMNPFEPGVVGANALHAVMTRDIARREERTVRGKSYKFFYNPMWGCFGDRTAGPAGTYYLPAAKPVNYFWNLYDQVLLRPSLMDKLADLRILDSDGGETLLTKNGLPDKSGGSDHLPILFRLDL
jgi:hypothetical protein